MTAADLWSDEAIQKTATEIGLTRGSDSHLPDPVRFARQARVLVDDVRQRFQSASTRPSVVLLRQEREVPTHPSSTSHPRLHNAATDLGGRLWIVGAAVTSATGIDLPGDDPGEIFSFVSDELGVGDWPAIYHDTAAHPNVVAWYPGGLSNDEWVYEGTVDQNESPSLADVLNVVENVYLLQLKDPLNQNDDSTLWSDGSKHWAHERAESRAQMALLSGLGCQRP